MLKTLGELVPFKAKGFFITYYKDLGINPTNAQIMNLRILRFFQDILRVLRALRLGLRLRKLKGPFKTGLHQ